MGHNASSAPLQLLSYVALDVRAVYFGRQQVAGNSVDAARKESIADAPRVFAGNQPSHVILSFCLDVEGRLTRLLSPLWQGPSRVSVIAYMKPP